MPEQITLSNLISGLSNCEIPTDFLLLSAADYLRYRYRLDDSDICITQDDTGYTFFTRFQVDNVKKTIFVEITIHIGNVVRLVPRTPSTEHPERWRLEGVTMTTLEERHEDMEIAKITKVIPFPLRYSLAHMPSVMPKEGTVLSTVSQ